MKNIISGNGKLAKYLMEAKEQNETILIDEGQEKESRESYIQKAEPGRLVAFRLNYRSKKDIKLTKVISGKVLENLIEEKQMVVETLNGLKYVVPYHLVLWVKTGRNWARGVYDEMRKGSVLVEDDDSDFDIIESVNEYTDEGDKNN